MSSNMINELMRQAQQMQERMKQVQEEAEKKVIEASSGGGMVTVKVNGRQEILSIQIEPEIVDAEDIEMLQDLIVAAVNEGIRQSKEMLQDEMKKLTGGLNIKIPGLF
ncbi:MAG: YbaB/EbfC family nucleoid-associated protein [Nitrospirae bacterium CG_4_9_14_3_um_filter_53_35]|nr:MAG: YbaB/EbfC family nucleoid-associated protein [Nitrospirae bacterium CG2_30_53_67]PIS37552.1 MAG: YbaB/EbfC family nucleoid-associated protein [Nitrospirae bacterium CG08_land_8_20_14_0_20_52_24]PIV85728.1 MAG: YbaB/EbfC family nucleoid-associated protein [Nitrospirae bacterium CG17_big_fil_post_rev_8_21_14_2_50_50_9]PIW85656.1 MAG: YbaB/EbfC family nucleoid-associated protein [Nitrospirae bacterium CG_4_8_14_3_um_filter_50_41]PIX87039.1 MAG: YbaB/EbfC family nucleoid-associated protein 